MNAFTFTCVAVASTLVATAAHADDKSECLDAAAKGQRMRDTHKLVEARDAFRTCARASCPAVVQGDCASWLADAEKAVPTVVLSAKDDAGNDLFDVDVSVDGAPLVTKLDGSAIPVDPGAHVFRFQRASGAPADRQVLVQEGQKAVVVAARLGAAGQVASQPPPGSQAVAAPSPSPPTAGSEGATAGASSLSSWRTVGWIAGGVGVAGLAVGAAFGFVAVSKKSSADCDATGACTNYGAVSDAKSAATVANVGLIAGGVLLASGAVLALFGSPRQPHATASSASLQAVPTVGPQGAGMTLEGRW